MLDVYELNIFVTAAETENFSEAARQLNLTQPAISMQIRALEKELDMPLFHRMGRTLTLTEKGKALVPMAQDMVRRSIRLREEIESLKGAVVGQLKIGCSTTVGKYFLPSLVARFRERFPRVHVKIYNGSREIILGGLCEGELNLAVVSASPTGVDTEYRHFFDDHVVLVASSQHPWAKRDFIAPEELLNANFIMRDPQSGTQDEVNQALQQVGVGMDRLNVVMEIGNSEAISMAVEEGIGVAFVSRTVARRGIEVGRLKEIRVAGLSLRRQIYIAYSRRHPATRARTEFWNFVQEPDNEKFLTLAA